ncbi:MAG: hypothetical protein KA198_03790 [Chitinophagaceae bacterium]|nr:hypothetical protein [Chitinophagaceae bacterium]
MKTLEQLELEKGSFSIGDALSQGWQYVSKNLGYYILGGIIAVLAGLICGFIPFGGSIANSLLLTPCFLAGAIYVTWRISNGIPWTNFGDMFKGFNYLSPLFLSSLIQFLVGVVVVVLFFLKQIPIFIDFFKMASGSGAITHKDEIRDLLFEFLTPTNLILGLVAMLIVLFVSVIWAFKSHFIVIYNMGAWPAMEMSRKIATKNFLSILGLMIVLGLILIVSAIPCGIGLLFSYPLMIGATYSAFAQITHCNDGNDINQDGFDFMKSEPAGDQTL